MVDKISLNEVRKRLEANPALVLVEALPEQYYRHSHIPGAISLSHDLAREALVHRCGRLVLVK
jgi:3-mercaptopyruvate sulfurtransferase SseA